MLVNPASHGSEETNPAFHASADDPPAASPIIVAALTDHREPFLRYLISRLGDKSTAEDVLQSFCVRVISNRTQLRNRESVVAWLYRVLRSVLTDYHRSEGARQRREANFAQEQITLYGDSDDIKSEDSEESLCQCYLDLLPMLRPEYADILKRIDLSGERRDDAAAALGITRSHVRVRLHRARQALRKALRDHCGSCCESGFRQCHCSNQRHVGDASALWAGPSSNL